MTEETPIDSERLEELLKNHSNVAVVTDDDYKYPVI
jgi:nickel-dependent lactate racemase